MKSFKMNWDHIDHDDEMKYIRLGLRLDTLHKGCDMRPNVAQSEHLWLHCIARVWKINSNTLNIVMYVPS